MLHSLIDRLGRRGRVAVIAAVALAVVMGAGAWWFQQRDNLPDDAAFRVNGDTVSIDAVEERASTLQALYGVEIPEEKDEEDEFWRATAQSMVLSHVIEEAADELDVSIPKRTTQQALSQYVTSYFGEGAEGRDAFVTALAAQGTSEELVRDEVGRHLLLTKLYTQVTEDVAAPGAKEVREAYGDRRCELTSPERRRIRNIVVTSKDDAKTVMAALKQGTSFAELARTRSADTSTADSGGDLGLVARDDLEEAYAEVAFSADRDEVFGPIRSEHGWNIGTVVKIAKPVEPPFKKVRSQLAELLLQEAKAGAWRDWLQSKLDESDAVYADDYEPKDPKSLPETMSNPAGGSGACDAEQ